MAFRVRKTATGFVVSPPRSRALLLALCAAWNLFGYWMFRQQALGFRLIALGAAAMFAVLAVWASRSRRITLQHGQLRCAAISVPLSEIDDVVFGPEHGTTPRQIVSLQLTAGRSLRLPLSLDSFVIESQGGQLRLFDGRASPADVAAFVASLKDAIDDAKHATAGYRRLSTGPEALLGELDVDDPPAADAERRLTRR